MTALCRRLSRVKYALSPSLSTFCVYCRDSGLFRGTSLHILAFCASSPLRIVAFAHRCHGASSPLRILALAYRCLGASSPWYNFVLMLHRLGASFPWRFGASSLQIGATSPWCIVALAHRLCASALCYLGASLPCRFGHLFLCASALRSFVASLPWRIVALAHRHLCASAHRRIGTFFPSHLRLFPFCMLKTL